MTAKPARLQDFAKAESKPSGLPPDETFTLPEFELTLDFFLSKGKEQFTVESIIKKVFGDEGKRLSQPEQIYILLNAMKDLEIVAPLQFECSHCGATNPVAIELVKVMKTSGESKSHFYLEFDGSDNKHYIFEFNRPKEILETPEVTSAVAGIGMFMLQWLDAHNQGEDFDVLKMKLKDFLTLANLFGEKMFGVTFTSKFKCAKCKKQDEQEFSVTLSDLVDILNEI